METGADEDLMRRFLLGAVSPEERERVEDRLMTDGDYFDALRALEIEMGLDHLHGRTSPQEQEPFKKTVLAAPARRKEVEELGRFAAALESARRPQAVPARPVARPLEPARRDRAPWWQALIDATLGPAPRGRRLTLVGAAAVVLIAALVYMRAPAGVPQVSDSTTPQPTGVPANDGARPQSIVATFVLLPGASRAELRQANVFERPVGADEIALVTTVPDAVDTRVGAILRPVGGDPLPLRFGPEVTAVSGGIEVRVRAEQRVLPRGDYLLQLTRQVSGATPEPFATRFFTVDD